MGLKPRVVKPTATKPAAAKPAKPTKWVAIEGKKFLREATELDLSRRSNPTLKLSELPDLGQFPHLEHLNLSEQPVSLAGIEACIRLKSVSLNRHGEGFSHLAKLPALRALSLHDMNFESLEALPALPTLESLIADGCGLTSLKGIDRFPALRALSATDNALKSLEGLGALSALDDLRLSGNQIASMEGLAGLSNLDMFDLSSNQISRIAGLESLARLRDLNLRGNPIRRIENLDGNAALEELSLLHTSITHLENLEHLSDLEWLRFDGKQVKSITRATYDHLLSLKNLHIHTSYQTGGKLASAVLTKLSILGAAHILTKTHGKHRNSQLTI